MFLDYYHRLLSGVNRGFGFRSAGRRKGVAIPYLPGLPQMPALVRHEKLKARPQPEFEGTNKWRGHFHAGKVQSIGTAEALA